MVKIILTYTIMALVVVAGPGASWIVSYCSVCYAGAGVEGEFVADCCAMQPVEDHNNEDDCCASHRTGTSQAETVVSDGFSLACDSVSVEDIQFDWEWVHSQINLSAWLVAVVDSLQALFTSLFENSSYFSLLIIEDPPSFTPRGYLSFLRILII